MLTFGAFSRFSTRNSIWYVLFYKNLGGEGSRKVFTYFQPVSVEFLKNIET